MNYKKRYYSDNGTVDFSPEMWIDEKFHKSVSKTNKDFLKAKQVESYTTDPMLTDDFQLVPDYNEIMKARKNERIRQAREARYRDEVDPLTLELYSRSLVFDVPDTERTEIVEKIKELRIKIKKELPYESNS